jgi:uncharacterized protein (TIGR02246 family)
MHLKPGTIKLTMAMILCCLALLTIYSRAQSAPGQTKSADADSAAIKRVFVKFDENFNRHDAQDTSVFSTDVDFTNMRGVHRSGPNEIAQWLAPLMTGTGTLSAAHRTDTVRSIRFLTPEVAAVDADSVITGSKAPDGSTVPPRKGLMIAVLTKMNGDWKIAIFHEAEFPPAAAATPAKK